MEITCAADPAAAIVPAGQSLTLWLAGVRWRTLVGGRSDVGYRVGLSVREDIRNENVAGGSGVWVWPYVRDYIASGIPRDDLRSISLGGIEPTITCATPEGQEEHEDPRTP